MKKCIKIIPLVLAVFMLTSCSLPTVNSGISLSEINARREETTETILRCLDNNDFETLKSFFVSTFPHRMSSMNNLERL